jgi:hypothetical protein
MVLHHFQQYSSFVVAVSFIGGGNQEQKIWLPEQLQNPIE